jgi:hypothetical protein
MESGAMESEQCTWCLYSRVGYRIIQFSSRRIEFNHLHVGSSHYRVGPSCHHTPFVIVEFNLLITRVVSMNVVHVFHVLPPDVSVELLVLPSHGLQTASLVNIIMRTPRTYPAANSESDTALMEYHRNFIGRESDPSLTLCSAALIKPNGNVSLHEP